jgi:PEP-CTERM motif
MNIKHICRSVSTALGLAIAVMLAAFPATAHVLLEGSSASTFSLPTDSGCVPDDCQLASSNTEVEWASTSKTTAFQNPNTLTGDPVTIGPKVIETSPESVLLGQLTWNNTNAPHFAPGQFDVDWMLALTFTSPTGTTVNEGFDLQLKNANQLDNFALANLTDLTNELNAALSFYNLDISNLAYNVSGGSSQLNGTNWQNPGTGVSVLTLTGDFSYPDPAQVPEPGSLGILGIALAAIAFIRCRRILYRDL